VYPTANWKDQPMNSAIYFAFVLILIILIHFLINFIHQVRENASKRFFGRRKIIIAVDGIKMDVIEL
jgi:hypothetical protein